VINTDHENKKYLPGVALSENVVAISDIAESVKDATAIVFVMPHQCKSIRLHAEPSRYASSLLKAILGSRVTQVKCNRGGFRADTYFIVLGKTLEQMEGKIGKGVKAISLIKVSA